MKYAHIVEAVFDRPWAILPRSLDLIAEIVEGRVRGIRLSEEEIADRLAEVEPRAAAMAPAAGNGSRVVAVIPIEGVLVPKADLFSAMSGATSYASITKQFRQALEDPAVSAIVFSIDSPGGMVDGLPELAAEIRAARGRKPISAWAQTAASAAYYLAAQADDIAVTTSGMVGSIGTIMKHQDLSGAYEQKGIRTTLISAGKHKADVTEYGPLSEEALAHLQELVDDAYNQFAKDVALGRNVSVTDVKGPRFGEGQMVLPKKAIANGMADRIATLEQTITAAAKRAGRSSRAAESEEGMRYAVLPVEDHAVMIENSETFEEAFGFSAEEAGGEALPPAEGQPAPAAASDEVELAALAARIHSRDD